MASEIETVRKLAARAATNPAVWPDTLWHLSHMMGGDMTVIDHVDKASGAIEIGFTDRPDIVATSREAYESYYFALNTRYKVAQGLPPNAIHHDDLVGDDKALGRSEFYVDFLAPLGLKYFIGSLVAEDAREAVILSLQRGAGRGRFGARERRDFAAVLPDLRNAVVMYLRMVTAPGEATLMAAFDRLAEPIAVLRADGRLVFANLAMAGLIAAGDIVRLQDRALVGARDSIGRALAEAIRQSLVGGGSGMASAASQGGALIVRIAPLAPSQGREFLSGSGQLLCLMIDDPSQVKRCDAEQAMQLYGLTKREASVGTLLAEGVTIDGIARRLGISRNTVRTHVAMLREKLGVSSALAAAAEMRRAVTPFA